MSGKQASLFSFFEPSPERPKQPAKKKGSAVIDLTADSDDDQPPRKRRKTKPVSEKYVPPGASSSKPTGTGSASIAGPTKSQFFEDSGDERPATKVSSSRQPATKTTTTKKLSATKLSSISPKKSTSSTQQPTASGTRRGAARLPATQPSLDSPEHREPSSRRFFGEDSDDEENGVQVEAYEADQSLFAFPPNSVSTTEVGPSGKTYTPLEQQAIKFKSTHPGILLLFEVGYKYKLYGEDARIGAQALGHVCFRYRNLLTSSFPLVSLHRHVKKLLSLGHKVGVIGQAETAALKKAGNNRNTLFERKLLHLWTAATYIDDLDSADNTDDSHQGNPPSILCLVEEVKPAWAEDGRATIGLISVTPSTGDVMYDQFEDTAIRNELETRLAYLKPWELLQPPKLSKFTEDQLRLVNIYSQRSQTRVERFKKLMDHSTAFDIMTSACREAFSNDETAPGANEDDESPISAIVDFPRQVVIALAHIYQYLQPFNLAHILLRANTFKRFMDRSHMLLNASTLANLEVFRSQGTFQKKGSLYGLLDRAETKFGSRLLKEWIGRPLVDKRRLQERLDAIDEIREPAQNGQVIDTLRDILKRFSNKAHDFPDLAKGISKIQHGKCTPQELGRILSAVRKIANVFKPFGPAGPGLKSSLLNDIVETLPSIQPIIEKHTDDFSFEAAKAGKLGELWRGEERYPVVGERNAGILGVFASLDDELKAMRKTLRRPALKFKDMSSPMSEEFVVELDNDANVPDNWSLISRTKKVSRYRSPMTQQLVFELEQHRELLQTESTEAFVHFQKTIADDYATLRHFVDQLATADCLVALAHVSMEVNYCRPNFIEGNTLDIVEGRHPILEALRSDPYMPNSLAMGGEYPRCKVITGPNMGGKSSFVRMAALLVIMAQVGCYVPAESMALDLHDALLARMGASDELMKGRSTFMVEMTETCEIIKSATKNSLVILDELGRGTSTFDGMAIASAVLEHLSITTGCKVLFITHYPHVALSLSNRFPRDISISHMAFEYSESTLDGTRTVHFLYQLRDGLAGSFGIECGRLAGLPEELLETAAVSSASLQEQVDERVKANRLRKAAGEMIRLQQPQERSVATEMLRSLRQILSSGT